MGLTDRGWEEEEEEEGGWVRRVREGLVLRRFVMGLEEGSV